MIIKVGQMDGQVRAGDSSQAQGSRMASLVAVEPNENFLAKSNLVLPPFCTVPTASVTLG